MVSSFYTVVRPTNCLDRMFYIQHQIGAQSNVLLSAHYAPTTTPDGRLSKEGVYFALRSVIETYPELSLIGVPKASSKGKKHLLLLAALHEINMETCVEFLDDHEPSSGPKVLEKLHNEWLWTDETSNPQQPWWKIVVLRRQEVVFVFHHIVCDGRFGHFFHRKFLEAINSFDQDQKSVDRIIKIDPERVRLSKETEQFWISSLSALRMAHIFVMFLLIRLFFGSKLFFNDLPKAKPYANSFLIEAEPHQRTKTRVASVRIPAAKMRQIIAVCREQKASFTPLLLAMISCTLAIDHYPEAKIGITNCALDARSLYPEDTDSSGKLLQCAAGVRKVSWLSKYRRVFGPRPIKPGKTHVDVDGAWDLVREYRESLQQYFQGAKPQLLTIFKASNGVSDDLEGLLKSTLPAVGLHLNNSFQISNLGNFSTSGEKEGPWKIDGMNFSASTVNGTISYNISINVAGVEGGDTIINASYEDGIIAEDMVNDILEGALEKIEAVL
ncbi:hypothetical protein BHE90_001649 [Fusarium euwallaceae]|uniref:Condensation domain-containing protein n=1 Tax=Fusarium euwallaceae TaxID=1147111 RepID=A0A430M774_9HYPO|nr:hypothetical protein BHE90_001649 [Fusarium euwallaceae]